MDKALPAKKALKIEAGFVGFFDILGYRSSLASGISHLTFKVIELLEGLPSQVEAALKVFVSPQYFEIMRPELERIRFRVFSDSIFLACAYDENLKKPSQAATFLMAANVLNRLMFEKGWPVRGGIAFGDFILGENALAGKPILDAFALGNSLDLAACAIHNTAENEFAALLIADAALNQILGGDGLARVRYLTPVKKSGAQEELSCLNLAWPALAGCISLETLPDVRQYVHQQFTANGKQIGLDAIQKTENTERFLRFLQCQFSK